MLIKDFISPQRICVDKTSKSKKAVLLKISELLADCEETLDARCLFNAFWQRESLGSTAIGHGVSLPHLRLASVQKIYGCFIKLSCPIDFSAADKKPVDLLIGLIVPENQPELHLLALRQLMMQFENKDFRQACRSSKNRDDLISLLAGHS